MDISETCERWRPRARAASILENAPSDAIGPVERLKPIRKPPNFQPAVQRWSFQLPPDQEQFHMAVFGAEAPNSAALDKHPLHDWIKRSLVAHRFGPTCLQHARSHGLNGSVSHLVSAYWVSEDRFAAWEKDLDAESWWKSKERLRGDFGTWREILRIPRGRQESLFWLDFPIGISASPEVALYPTPYCGYYGSMRDRLFGGATESLDAERRAPLTRRNGRAGFGQHWSVHAPHNLAVIRGGSSWGFMDSEQLANYEAQLRTPVSNGMDYLERNPVPSGCASMRWQRSTNERGEEEPDEYAHAYFLSLEHLEQWSEHHGSHAAIFGAAIRRYRHYGAANQLRTWHEMYVLPEGGQRFEYFNCHPDTGLLSWFDADQLG